MYILAVLIYDIYLHLAHINSNLKHSATECHGHVIKKSVYHPYS